MSSGKEITLISSNIWGSLSMFPFLFFRNERECLPASILCIFPGERGEPELNPGVFELSVAFCTSGTCTVSAGSVDHDSDGTAAFQERA